MVIQVTWTCGTAFLGQLEQDKTGCSVSGIPEAGSIPAPWSCFFVCSQRLETLQQKCQETCALLQGVIDSMKALRQPMASAVGVTPLFFPISLNVLLVSLFSPMSVNACYLLLLITGSCPAATAGTFPHAAGVRFTTVIMAAKPGKPGTGTAEARDAGGDPEP